MERLEPAMPDLLAAEWTTPDRYELRPDARRFESWEGFMAGKVALGTAVRYAMSIGLDDIRDRVTALAAQLRERLASIEGVTVHDKGRVRCGIVTFSSDRKPALAVLKELRNRRMNISRSVPSGALLDSLQRDLPDLARASVHYYNTEDEVERFVAAVSEIAGG
jgi:selenocysteine lyase/cysteine desulfurase